MRWKKQGLVFRIADYANDVFKTHAQVPTVLVTKDIARVYIAARPKPNLSLTTYVDLDINDLSRVVYFHNQPILKLGEAGTFDEFGIMPASVVESDGRVYLYYSGWTRTVGVPYHNAMGLAVSDDGGKTFEKISQGPILDRSLHDPFSATSPAVLKQGKEWHMWYTSGLGWVEVNGKYEHFYDIKHAYSDDGIHWQRDGQVAIAQEHSQEAITRPTVIEVSGTYHMWFCYRDCQDFRSGHGAYRIGYASSPDLMKWKREDNQSGLDASDEGWDAVMIAYPEVARINERHVMFYNGNDFGKDGFGVAILKDDEQ